MNQQRRDYIVAHLVNEREAIRERRERGLPAPWTKDHILQRYRFCNVRREQDRVTQWIAKNWRTPYAQHQNLTLAMVMARLLNWPSTLSEIGFPEQWDKRRFLDILRAKAARSERIWNGAYMITTCKNPIGKDVHVAQVLDRVSALGLRPGKGETLSSFASKLMGVHGLGGGFLIAQVIADLKYVAPLSNASDWWEWCLPGPGSERGLRWWLGFDKPIPKAEFQTHLETLRCEIEPLVSCGRLHMQDWQSVCCETDKYVRALNGGRPKQNYKTTEQDYSI